jgi:hypothetical protein
MTRRRLAAALAATVSVYATLFAHVAALRTIAAQGRLEA